MGKPVININTQELVDMLVSEPKALEIITEKIWQLNNEMIEKRNRTPEANTKELIVNYRRLKRRVEKDSEPLSKDEVSEFRMKLYEDLMLPYDNKIKTEIEIRNMEKSRRYCKYKVEAIERALEMYHDEVNCTEKDEKKREYETVYRMYIDPASITAQDLADELNVSVKSVYRYLGNAYKALAVYIF